MIPSFWKFPRLLQGNDQRKLPSHDTGGGSGNHKSRLNIELQVSRKTPDKKSLAEENVPDDNMKLLIAACCG